MAPDEEKEHLTRKIEQVKKDIESFQQAGKADKQIEVLHEYLEYLEDELKMLRRQL